MKTNISNSLTLENKKTNLKRLLQIINCAFSLKPAIVHSSFALTLTEALTDVQCWLQNLFKLSQRLFYTTWFFYCTLNLRKFDLLLLLFLKLQIYLIICGWSNFLMCEIVCVSPLSAIPWTAKKSTWWFTFTQRASDIDFKSLALCRWKFIFESCIENYFCLVFRVGIGTLQLCNLVTAFLS